MKKYITLLSIILTIISCEVLEGPYDTKEDCAGIIGGDNICGCPDSTAYNYNSLTTFNDETCCYVSGCTNPLALNYDSLACFDNDSCLFDGSDIYGCTDVMASNYNPLATIDDNNCIPFVKNVLIEDFTGHLCPNCPDAARDFDAIHANHGARVIGLAIHVSTAFARPYPASQTPKFQYDFRTQWGTEWDDFFGISNAGLPRGMVNRTLYPNDHGMGRAEWANTVANELTKDIDFGINISTTTNAITINSTVLNNLNGNYNLVICLTESYIINWQKDGQENVEDYEHNHVLRTVLVDEPLSNTSNFISGQKIEKISNYDLSVLQQYNIDYSANTAELGNGNAGGWVAENMSVIAYIYDNTTQEIVQVEEAHLTN
tara:strand:+ start:2136 stop:3257 length:1122 start_codon:yes stop_codon:yes gene_type:complete